MKRARCFSGSHSSTEGGNKNPVCRSIGRKLLITRRPRHAENQLGDSNASRAAEPVKSDRLLDASGTPVETTLLDADRVAKLWTLREGKHNSFPYIQLKRPLLSVPR